MCGDALSKEKPVESKIVTLSQAQLYPANLTSRYSVCMFGWAEAAETKAVAGNYKCTKLAYDGLL